MRHGIDASSAPSPAGTSYQSYVLLLGEVLEIDPTRVLELGRQKGPQVRDSVS